MLNQNVHSMTDQKNIVLTGCSRGLGLALAHEFIAAGHCVYGAARDAEAIAKLNIRYPDNDLFSVVDISNAASVSQWCSGILESCGSPDIVINNAGIINKPAPLWEVPAAEFLQLMDTNIRGVHHVITQLLPPMIKRGSGIIINLSSGWGRSVSAGVAPYCATKWAIEGLTKALAEELPAGMAAIPLSPGIIDTGMLRTAWGDEAGAFHTAEVWATTAAPFILSLGPEHNGRSLSTPD